MDTFVIRPRMRSQVTQNNADVLSSRNVTFFCVIYILYIYIYNYRLFSRIIHYMKIVCNIFRHISSPKNIHILFILIINQLNAKKKLFYNKFISCLYMFRTTCAHRQEAKNCIIQPLLCIKLVTY